MREFFQTNIPWIFEGVGVVILIGLASLVRRFFSRRVPRSSLGGTAPPTSDVSALPVNPVVVPSRPDTLSAEHMIKTVSAAAPLARDHVKLQFIDIPINWKLPFSDARKTPDRSIATVYFLLPHSNYEVKCEASVVKFPFLRVATEGEEFVIRGVVADVSSVEVVLRDVVLTR